MLDAQAKEAEDALLASLLAGGPGLSDILVQAGLRIQDFGDRQNSLVMGAIVSLDKQGVAVDPVTVAHELDRSGDLARAGGKEYIGFLLDAVPTPTNVLAYASIVAENAQRHRLMVGLNDAAQLASSGSLSEAAKAVAAIVDSIGEVPGGSRMQFAPLSDVAMRSVSWLWPNYLPLGKLTVIDGFPGQGKSTLVLDIAARLSRGAPMPDGSGGNLPIDSVIITYEDDPADTLRPRLEAAGGDPSRVFFIKGVGSPGARDLLPPSFPRDLALLESLLRANPAIKLVVIDPLMASLGPDVDSHKDQDIRRPLIRLSSIASDCGVAVLIVRHVRKNPGGNAISAGGGSIGIIGQARVGLLVERHPDIPDAAVLAVAKSNVGPLAQSLAFRKVSATVLGDDGTPIATSKLEWLGSAALSADELLAGRDEGGSEGQDIDGWLADVLGGGAVDRKTILRAAAEAGFAERTVDRAAKRLKVRRERKGFGSECRAYWSLPSVSSASSATSAGSAKVAEVAEVVNPPTQPVGSTATRRRRTRRVAGETLFEPGSAEEAAFVARLEAQATT